MTYNYIASMIEDVKEAIRDFDTTEYQSRNDFEEALNDALWIWDSVTGNASGSYTFNSYTAKEYVTDNMGLAKEALIEFGTEPERIADMFLNEDWESMDVIIRCYLLGQAISEALDEIEDELKFAEDENEDEDETA